MWLCDFSLRNSESQRQFPASPRLTQFPKKRQLGRTLMKMAGSRCRDRNQHKHFRLSLGRKWRPSKATWELLGQAARSLAVFLSGCCGVIQGARQGRQLLRFPQWLCHLSGGGWNWVHLLSDFSISNLSKITTSLRNVSLTKFYKVTYF